MIVRFATLFLAAACLLWAGLAGPPAVRANAMSQLGKRIAAGETFRAELLEPLLEAPEQTLAGGGCYSADLRGRMLVATRIAELALEASQVQTLNLRLAAARMQVKRLLACDPYDSLGWLALYWTTGHLDGFGGKVFDLLAMSYRTGPLEGWIAFRRNPQAAFAFAEMSEAMQARIVGEWRHLVIAAQHEPAAITLERVAPAYRQAFLNERDRIPAAAWADFSQFIERRGSSIDVADHSRRQR